MKPKEHITSLDTLRTISILAVILIHTTTRVLEVTHYDLITHSWTLFLNQISRFAVPVFIIISGFVLETNHHLNESFWHYIKKRASKILVPYLTWSFLYYFFIYTNNNDSFLYAILKGSASYQLYFIPTLCIYYALFPFIHKIYNLISGKLIFGTLLALELWLSYLDYFVKQFKYADPIRIFLLSYIFFVIGMILARNKEKLITTINKWKYMVAASILPVMYYVFSEGKSGYYKTFNIESFYSQWRPSVFIYSILIFVFLFYVFRHVKRQLKIMSLVSKLSFLVFFIHVIVLEVVWKNVGHSVFASNGGFVGKALFDPLFFLAVTTISFILAYLIHSIPGARKIFG